MQENRSLITRSPHQASELADALRAHNVDPILIPTIELADPTTFAPLDAALATLTLPPQQGGFHWLLFTSANAVEAFAVRLQNSVILSEASLLHREAQSKDLQPRPDPAIPLDAFNQIRQQGIRIAAIGPATARALTAIGLPPNLLPPHAVAESLAAALLPHALQPPDATGQVSPTRFLLLRAEQARETLPESLSAAGADVTIAPAYRTIIPAASVNAIRTLFSTPARDPDAITFTSSSTATNLLALLQAAGLTLPPGILRASIGPITSATLTQLGFPPHVEAAEPTVTSLAQNVVKAFNFN